MSELGVLFVLAALTACTPQWPGGHDDQAMKPPPAPPSDFWTSDELHGIAFARRGEAPEVQIGELSKHAGAACGWTLDVKQWRLSSCDGAGPGGGSVGRWAG